MRLSVAGLLVAQALWATAAYAEPTAVTGNSKIREETAKQTAIYKSVGHDVPDGYVVGRSLMSYAFILSSDFKRSLGQLGPGDRWLDIGAGEGRAVLDYSLSKYEAMFQGTDPNGGKARAVAMSIEDRRTVHWHQAVASASGSPIQYLFGKPLRQYSNEELGRFQLITDVLGGFSYSQDLSLFMEKTLGLLAVNGTFYTVLQDVHWENGANKPHYEGAAFLTELVKTNGEPMKVCSWLKSISCVQVTCSTNAELVPPVESYRVQKVCDQVEVPKLQQVHFEAGTPPERRFRVQGPVPAGLEQTRATR